MCLGRPTPCYVLVWMVIGVIQEGSVNLTRRAHVQTSARASTQAIFPVVAQRRIHPTHFRYGSLIQSRLSSWCDQVLHLRSGYDDAVGYVLRQTPVGGLSRASISLCSGEANMAVAVQFIEYPGFIGQSGEPIASVSKSFSSLTGFVDQLLRHIRQHRSVSTTPPQVQ